MQKHKLQAVHDDDLLEFLDSLHLLRDIEARRLKCHYCGTVITIEGLHSLYPESGQVRIVCNRSDCIASLHHRRYNS